MITTKNKKRILSAALVSVILTGIVGCGSSNADAEKTDSGQVIETKEADVETAAARGRDAEISVDTVNEGFKTGDMYTYEEYTDIFTVKEIDRGDGTQVDFDTMEDFVEPYTLTDSMNIYSYFGTYAGYTKPDIEVMTSGRDSEWVVVAFAEYSYLVKTEDFEKNAVPIQREIENTLEIPQEATASENVTTDVPAVKEPASTGSTNGTLIEQEQITAQENTKYTPEEAVAVYRSIMEAGGMKWNPSLKDGGSWGTGWIYLDKGEPEDTAYSNLRACKMGDTAGNPCTDYYLEVTGVDENAVYITHWSD